MSDSVNYEPMDANAILLTDAYRKVVCDIFGTWEFSDHEASQVMGCPDGTLEACRGDRLIWITLDTRLRLYNLWYMMNKAKYPEFVMGREPGSKRPRKCLYPVPTRRWLRMKNTELGGRTPIAVMMTGGSPGILHVYNRFTPAFPGLVDNEAA